jgi:hypothetical protein
VNGLYIFLIPVQISRITKIFNLGQMPIHAKTNDFNNVINYVGSSVYAFDRNKMLTGATYSIHAGDTLRNGL